MKVSIIVPVHNVEKYLPEALESVIKQTYTDWELILVENRSRDRSYEVCLSYAEKYPDISVYQEKTASLSHARNRGMQEAKGEYLMFLDSDDYLSSPAIIEKMVHKIEQTDADVVICNYERLWNGRLLAAASHESYSYKDRESESFRFEGFFSPGNLSYVWGRLYRADFLKENQIIFKEFAYAEDKMFNTECYAHGIRYAFIKDRGYVYRKNTSSISHHYNPKSRECWLGIAHEMEKVLRRTKKTEYEGIVRYTIFFAAFFDAKMEYTEHGRSLRSIWRTLRKYGHDPLAKRVFRDLMCGKDMKGLSSGAWKIMMRGFSLCMKLHMFLILSVGIKVLIELRVDERMSDTGLRE